MPLTIGENSYVDVGYADTYFTDRLHSETWVNAVSGDKEKALIMATKKIDRLKLQGRKADATQILNFPRSIYIYDKSSIRDVYGYAFVEKITQSGFSYPGWFIEYEVSESVKQATCEEAYAILKGEPKRMELQRQGVKSMSIGNLSETYSGNPRKLISYEAEELLQPYLSGGFEIC